MARRRRRVLLGRGTMHLARLGVALIAIDFLKPIILEYLKNEPKKKDKIIDHLERELQWYKDELWTEEEKTVVSNGQ